MPQISKVCPPKCTPRRLTPFVSPKTGVITRDAAQSEIETFARTESTIMNSENVRRTEGPNRRSKNSGTV